jgi:hypothetical protein
MEAVAAWLRQARVEGMAPLIAPVPVVVEVSVGAELGGIGCPGALPRLRPSCVRPASITRAGAMNLCPCRHKRRQPGTHARGSARPRDRTSVTSASVRDHRGRRPPAGQHGGGGRTDIYDRHRHAVPVLERQPFAADVGRHLPFGRPGAIENWARPFSAKTRWTGAGQG